MYRPTTEASEETSPVSTFISDFHPPELEEDNFQCLRTPGWGVELGQPRSEERICGYLDHVLEEESGAPLEKRAQ